MAATARRLGWEAAVVTVMSLGAVSGALAQAAAPAPGPAVADPNQGNPCSIQWFEAHGWLMWLAFGIFFPLGILVSRYGQFYFRQWFYTHIGLQVMGVILSTAAVAISINKFPVVPPNNTHVKLGFAVMILVWLQPLLSVFRPKRGSAIRAAWYVVHWLFGTTLVILGWFNIFKGLDEYISSWAGGERKAWYVIWGVQIALLSFIYLFLDRLPHIQRQSQDPSLINPNVAKDIPLGTHDRALGMERTKFVNGNGAV